MYLSPIVTRVPDVSDPFCEQAILSSGALDVLVNYALNPVQLSSFVSLRRLQERAAVISSRFGNCVHVLIGQDSVDHDFTCLYP